jgi:hypothetical protein
VSWVCFDVTFFKKAYERKGACRKISDPPHIFKPPFFLSMYFTLLHYIFGVMFYLRTTLWDDPLHLNTGTSPEKCKKSFLSNSKFRIYGISVYHPLKIRKEDFFEMYYSQEQRIQKMGFNTASLKINSLKSWILHGVIYVILHVFGLM